MGRLPRAPLADGTAHYSHHGPASPGTLAGHRPAPQNPTETLTARQP